MLKLNRPNRSARETFVACITRIRDAKLRQRLENITQEIVDASAAFDIAAAGRELHKIVRKTNVGGVVTRAEMEAVYVQRMAKKGVPGRPIYDELISAPAHGRCPLCGQRSLTTLDHHLPKTLYPSLVVAPLNLVPSCADCNKAKLAAFPRTAADVSLHPYFDDVEGEQWLFAEVIKTRPAALRFYVDAPNALDDLLAQRLQSHFAAFGLSRLYAAEAAEELLNIRYQLERINEVAGPAGVRAHLRDEAESRQKARLNSWRTAAYASWADSDWFCDGGFKPAG